MSYQIQKEDKFQYIDQGEGEVLLLLHGLFGALSNWQDVLNHFSQRYRVVIPLMPIFEMNILKLSVEGLANFIHDFVEFKGFKRVNILGNSLGGHVALVYVKKYPEKVHSLLLTGSSGLYENAFGASYPRKGDKEYLKQRISLTFYDPASTTDELVDEVFETIQDKGKLLRILTMAKSAIRHNMRKDLPGFKMPVCLIWGKQDTITPPEVCEEFHQLLPNSEKHYIDQCGHAPMMERPVEFNHIASSFYAKLFPN
ncbi:MAG: alpha/beta hydrolase [Bacteroidetes bacterium]|nr:alpha/beta hydrolase [Bacteroidota bacterium]